MRHLQCSPHGRFVWFSLASSLHRFQLPGFLHCYYLCLAGFVIFPKQSPKEAGRSGAWREARQKLLRSVSTGCRKLGLRWAWACCTVNGRSVYCGTVGQRSNGGRVHQFCGAPHFLEVRQLCWSCRIEDQPTRAFTGKWCFRMCLCWSAINSIDLMRVYFPNVMEMRGMGQSWTLASPCLLYSWYAEATDWWCIELLAA